MSKIKIQLSGVAAELALGNYMPTDATIFKSWEDFFHYNDLIHTSQLLADHISEIKIYENEQLTFQGRIPKNQMHMQNSVSPFMVHRALYLRTECVEQAEYSCEFEVDNFDKRKLIFELQDFDLLFKTGQSFLDEIKYEDQILKPEWISGKPIGNICLLCRYEDGFLIPLYDAVGKRELQVKNN